MIPRTFPSTFAANGQQQMVVYSLPSITGLTAWIDYIPVKGVTTESATLENTYANGGYQVVDSLASLTGKQAWLDYIPVYEDASYTKPWSTDAGGYIPTSALAALLLDFTSGRLDPRITFSRTTNATLTNSAGLVANAPMNLLTFSEQFDNAAWLLSNATVSANQTAAPDGTTTADKLVEAATTSAHEFARNPASGPLSFTAGVTYAYSFYVKAAGRTQINIQADIGASTFPASANALYDFSGAGVVVSQGASATASISSVGNGWFRCVFVATATATTSSRPGYYVGLAVSGSASYTGNGTSGVFLWGAQLELGSTATTYNPTTVKNLLGFTEHFDNAAWTKSNAFVQTNLLLQSEAFENAIWTGANSSVTANATTAPNGTATADKVIASAGSAQHYILQNVSIAAIGTYTASFYAKSSEYTSFDLWLLNAATADRAVASFNLTAGTTTNGTAGGAAFTGQSSTITDVGNGWYRCTLTATTTGGAINLQSRLFPSSSATYTGNGVDGIFIWGAQLVQGTSAGDYKATYAAAAAVGYTDIYGQPFAQKLVENTANTSHGTDSPSTAVISGTKYTASIYAKQAEKRYVFLALNYSTFTSGNGVCFDLQTGAIVATGTGSATAGSITDAGNGWYRCSISLTATASATNAALPAFYISNSAASSIQVYTGDGTSGIYIFGAQLSDSASVDPYVYQPVAAPSSVAYYGPRFDYDPVTLAPKGLLIEEQRSNLLLNSAVLSTQVVTVAATAHTLSFYGTGTIVLSGASTGTVVGTGAYPARTTLTFTPTVGVLTLTVTGSVTMAQLEAGAFATSYIPTVASQVTRAADSASMIGNNFARWYNVNEGTVFADFIPSQILNTPVVWGQSTTDTSGGYLAGGLNHWNGSTVLGPISSVVVGQTNKGVIAYTGTTSRAGALNASAVTTSASTIGNFNTIRFGAAAFSGGSQFLNGTIKRFAYYNRRLSNTELQGITS